MTVHRSTSRLIFRPPFADDLATLFGIHAGLLVTGPASASPLLHLNQTLYLLDRWLTQWRDSGYGQWAIATREAPDTVIGFGGLSRCRYLDNECVNLEYRFAVAEWGKGYATELGKAAVDYAFTELRAQSVYGFVRPEHPASRRVLEKVGLSRICELDDVPGELPSHVYKICRA